jgi:hypothetical protein
MVMSLKISFKKLKKMKKILGKVLYAHSVMNGISVLENSVINVGRNLKILLSSFIKEL